MNDILIINVTISTTMRHACKYTQYFIFIPNFFFFHFIFFSFFDVNNRLPGVPMNCVTCNGFYLNCFIRKQVFCICKNKSADQLCGDHTADQCLCFCCIDSTNPLLPKSKTSSLQLCSVVVHPGLCRTWSQTPGTGFLMKLLKSVFI